MNISSKVIYKVFKYNRNLYIKKVIFKWQFEYCKENIEFKKNINRKIN